MIDKIMANEDRLTQETLILREVAAGRTTSEIRH